MKHKFWKWVTNEAPDSFGSERMLYLDGQISDETWWGDEVTPKAFKEELNAGSGDITLWINSPGGDCFAAAQIYNMFMDYPGNVTSSFVQKLKPHEPVNKVPAAFLENRLALLIH